MDLKTLALDCKCGDSKEEVSMEGVPFEKMCASILGFEVEEMVERY